MAWSADLLPTFAKLCKAATPRDRVIDGKDIWPLIVDGARTPHDSLYWKRYDQQAVRRGDWKLVLNGELALGAENRLQGDDRVYLSNLAHDPGESSNVANQHPNVVRELTNLARTWELDVS